MIARPYDAAIARLAVGKLGWDDRDRSFAVMLATEHPFDPRARFASEISAELARGGYARRPLDGRSVAVAADGSIEFRARPVGWQGLLNGQAVAALIVFEGRGPDEESLLVCAVEVSFTARGDVTVRWGSAAGDSGPVMRLAAAC